MPATPMPVAPIGATDCHMHIYGPPDRYPVAPTNPSPVPFASDLVAYRKVQARLGLSRMVVVQPAAYGTDNRCTLDAVAALGPQAARAVVAVTPETPMEELHRLHAAGARGARAVMLRGGILPWDRLGALAAHVAPLGWHVQLQFDGGELPMREALIRNLACPVVIDHIGRFHAPVTPEAPAVRVLLRLLESRRAWVKASSPYGVSRRGPPEYADVAAIARAVIAAVPERVVWGSNWPHPNAPEPKPDEAALLGLLAAWTPSEATRQAILVENPARLYDF
ncbi:2-pyrone-4,6-dicarboxylate hydrolase [Siccirubricoccus deserti]|uniref:Amidohydrolase family protein n=1 Tax=Siccirubricoccus deserti TaxID=2013562 RepID=A0A9X0UFN3_9PROT|nr:amidohydrolase family protein [Siccirubricoccus deserti]MBC4018073.1 amidohydrolase family protein [Siccirubricoccus deserti]GGC62718.1 2-pyrone-4,6-dicarboxylate hydrolase [Siccirubricoccus deserti]